MKIVIISGTTYPSSPDYYGSEVECAILADALGNLGHEVTLIAAVKSMKGNYDLKLLPCTWGELNYGVELSVLEYEDVLVNADFVIDYSPLKMYCEEVWFYKRELLTKQILTYFENGNFLNPRPPVNIILNSIVPSEALRKVGIEYWKIPANNIHVIPYPIRTDWYPFEPNKGNYLLYLGACRPEKGIYTILEIAKLLPEEKFVFAWHSFSNIHKKAEEAFLKEMSNLNNCEFIDLGEEDSLKNKVKLYQKAKALLKPDTKDYVEYWGLVSAEAMSCGTPVITAKHGANNEVVVDGKTGFLCETIEEYIEAIKKIDQIKPEDCRNHVVENFDSPLIAKRFEELYHRLKT